MNTNIKRPPKVLVVLTTGRLSYRNVIRSLHNNVNKWHPKVLCIDLLINFDVSFKNTKIEDFFLSPPNPLIEGGKIIFAGPDFVDSAEWIEKSERSAIKLISPNSGYGQKKNACIIYAIRYGYDVVIFWDDDEYAFYLSNEGSKIQQVSSDIFGAHINCDADVTFGFWTGYVSPIPDSFYDLDCSLRKKLTEALSTITDVVDTTTFFNRSSTYRIEDSYNNLPIEINQSNGGKWISGGNLGIRCGSVLKCKLPAFYTPTDSRGDDSIFSTRLNKAKVMKVNAGIYHDAFGYLNNENFIISEFSKRRVNQNNVKINRFASVLRGWIAYAPLLTILRGIEDVRDRIMKSIYIMSTCEKSLLYYFGRAWGWEKPSSLLLSYLEVVERELFLYKRTQEIWEEICKNTKL
ncbi:MAG: hypothetical protein GYA51_12610 [Candidatus Methanofastidiosa archaeon]|nr:hypothetical protein [Candidatus Methanofastidiosa archaeon]